MSKEKKTESLTVEQLVSAMRENWKTFDENATEYAEKGKASSAKRCRVAIGDLRKMVTPYRKAIISELKAKKASKDKEA